MARSSFFRRLFRSTSPASKPVVRRSRLAMESLEDRAVPATIFVHNGDDGAVAPLTPLTALGNDTFLAHNLRSAVFHHNDFSEASTIVLDTGGTFHLTDGELHIVYTGGSNALTIESNGDGLATIDRQGADQFRLFEVNGGGATTLDHLRLTGGAATGFGGAVLNNAGGDLTLSVCTLDSNTSQNGGGLANLGTAAIIGSTFSNNHSLNFGGGIVNWGGGILVLNSSTIDLNQADADGGGIDNRSGLTLINCTIAGNAVGLPYSSGGGMALESGVCVMSNTIVTDNLFAGAPGDVEGKVDLAHSFNNLIGWPEANNFVNGSNGNLVGVPAQLGPLAYNGGPTETQVLLPGSPAINAGSNALIPAGVTTDQRGFARVVGGTVDIGAFELNQAPTNIALSNASVPENQPAGTVVGTMSTTDPDAGDTFSYSVVGGDVAAFTVDAAGHLKTATAFNYEAKGAYTVRVRSTDAAGLSIEKDFAVAVLNVNGAPTLTVPAAQIAFEDVAQTVAGITVGDPDGDALTVNLLVGHGSLTLGTTAGLTVAGNGSGMVTISGSTTALNAALATLSYRGTLNFAGDDWLSITVRDSNLSTSGSMAIHVTSAASQATDLQTRVNALQAAGVLNIGQANALDVKLDLKGNDGDAGKVQSFLNQVQAFRDAGILTLEQANDLSIAGRLLLQSLSVK